MGRKLSLAVVLTLALGVGHSVDASAQRNSHDTRNYFDYGELFYAAAHQSSDPTVVDVSINTASAMFSFVRAQKIADLKRGAYYAVRDIHIEATEPGNAMPVVTRGFRDTLFVNDFASTTAKNQWHALARSLVFPRFDSSKQYTVKVEVRDGILGRLAARPASMALRAPEEAKSNAIWASDLQFFESISDDEALSKARGASYAFSRDILGTMSFRPSGDASNYRVILDVHQKANKFLPADTGAKGHVEIAGAEMIGGSYTVAGEDSMLRYTREKDAAGLVTARFTIPGAALEQGIYEITARVMEGGREVSKSKRTLTLDWPDMPLSLYDARDAIAPLRYVMEEEQYEKLESGNKSELFQRIYSYWKSQDPTPGTAFNERMATFYERSDYAAFNFATGRVLDGALTDRGKIYILYGAPARVERKLLPGEAPLEVWVYGKNIKKEFSFIDKASRGDFKLATMRGVQ